MMETRNHARTPDILRVSKERRARMAWFRCFIRGENFPGELAGATGLVGFYVTRFVEVADEAGAEAAAVQTLRADPRLAPPPGYTPSGQAKVTVEEITKVTAAQAPQVQPGFAWHPMEEP